MKNISKIVVSKDDGKCFGYILDITLDFQTFNLMGYIVVEEETENEFFVNIKDISFSNEFAFVQDVSKMQFVSDRNESLMSKTVLSSTAENLGRVIGLEFVKNHCKKLITTKGEIKTSLIRCVGDYVLLGKKISTSKSFPKINNEIKIEVLSTPKIQMPEKISLSPNFYLGKTAQQDIFGYNNERLVSKGEKINKTNLEKIKKHNRLNQLFFAIKNEK